MRGKTRQTCYSVRILPGILLIFLATIAAPAQRADFSGLWKQDNDLRQPKRSGEATLTIVHRDPDLTVETYLSHGLQNQQHAVQKYTTDGQVSVSTGTDGDEFHTSVVWKDTSLFFSIEEHEDGRILRSRETWVLTDGAATLQRTRERPDGEKQILIYRRLR